MLPRDAVPSVDANETLARFIFSRRHISYAAGTVKANAFVPHPHSELSVNRDREATDAETWGIGEGIAEVRGITLYGRGDAIAATYHSQKLKTMEAPIDGNPNHVIVTGWPMNNKAAQKLIAQEIAAVAKFIESPKRNDR